MLATWIFRVTENLISILKKEEGHLPCCPLPWLRHNLQSTSNGNFPMDSKLRSSWLSVKRITWFRICIPSIAIPSPPLLSYVSPAATFRPLWQRLAVFFLPQVPLSNTYRLLMVSTVSSRSDPADFIFSCSRNGVLHVTRLKESSAVNILEDRYSKYPLLYHSPPPPTHFFLPSVTTICNRKNSLLSTQWYGRRKRVPLVSMLWRHRQWYRICASPST